MFHRLLKRLILLPIFLLLATRTTYVLSAIDLRMAGSVIPSACSMAITGEGIFNFGSISAANLRAANYNDLQSMRQTLSISCSAPALVAIGIIDNRSGTASSSLVDDESLFGLGRDASGNAIGGYYLATSGHILNGGPAYASSSSDAGESWSSENFLKNGAFYMHSWTDSLGSAPLPISTAMVEVIADPVIAPLNTLDVTQDFMLDGSATIELIYL
ncbi:DUF1120 domain-containing protein [Pseudomonas sp. NPDC098747]|uniref:DUF1120 domain-containing protein n=1 Tax=Pseudomonas sp. NPDC098747 TaxID=3364487 RepID=UPI00383B387C